MLLSGRHDEIEMKSIILGGSNSVLVCGIRRGIEKRTDALNLALGGTSSLQNLSSMVKNTEKIADADFVVTESNVNDSLAAHAEPVSLSDVIEIIDDYYQALRSLTNRVYVLILPINHKNKYMEAESISEPINAAHRRACLRYGFRLVDMSKKVKSLSDEQIQLLMPHPRHVVESYLYHLGERIVTHAKENKFEPFEDSPNENSYFVLDHKATESSFRVKKNSRFSEKVVDINKEVFFNNNLGRSRLVGISSWNDGYAGIKIYSESGVFVKFFSGLNTLAHVASRVTVGEGEIKLESCNIEDVETEGNIFLGKNEKNSVTDFSVVDLILRQCERKENTDKYLYDADSIDITDLLAPDLLPYVRSSNESYRLGAKYGD